MDDELRKAARTTIVGGQPPGNERPLAIVPVGIEELLAMAAVDARFAAALCEQRATAIASSGVTLTPTEARVLEAIDTATLRQMVARVGGALPEPDRRAFLGRSAAALLAIASGGVGVAAASGCRRPEPVRGIKPDAPPRAVDPAAPPAPPGPATQPDAAGIDTHGRFIGGLTVSPRPDAEPPRPPPVPAGIRPDRQPSRERTRGSRPDRGEELVDPFNATRNDDDK